MRLAIACWRVDQLENRSNLLDPNSASVFRLVT